MYASKNIDAYFLAASTRVIAWTGCSFGSRKLDFCIQPSAVVLSVMLRAQSPAVRRPSMMSIQGVITAQGIPADYSTRETKDRVGLRSATQNPDCCSRQGLRGRSLNNKFDQVTERQVDSCRCLFLLCPELIALIPNPSHTFCLF